MKNIVKKPRVLIDVDGVLRDFIGALINIYQREYPEHHVKQPIDSRNLEKYFPIGVEIYHFIDKCFKREILEDAPSYPGAVEALYKWEKDFDIVIATAQPPCWRAETFVWVGKNNLPVNELHNTYEKFRVPGIALLDDFVENLEKFEAVGRLAICLNQPWNQQWKGLRVNSVDEYFVYMYQYLQQNKTDFYDDILLA